VAGIQIEFRGRANRTCCRKLGGAAPQGRQQQLSSCSRKKLKGFQDGGYREEAESEPPIGKSWRDAGDTLSRHNH
jgi:hypothetical protein